MCTYITETISIAGSGKGPDGWFRVTHATVYFDHPVHAMADNTLNIPGGLSQAGLPAMFTSHWTPNLSVHMPNVSPHGAGSSGMVTVPSADSLSQ